MPRFIIFYDDGTIYSNDDGAWEDAPGRGVQIVLFYDSKRGWIMRHSGDYYRMDDNGCVVAMDWDGMVDHVIRMLGIIKQGYMLNQDDWDALFKTAYERLVELQIAEKNGST